VRLVVLMMLKLLDAARHGLLLLMWQHCRR
jgi:hypothetical protein